MSDICKSADIADDCSGIKLNVQSLETVEKFCYLRDALGAREGGFDSVIIMIRSGLCKFRDLVPFQPVEVRPYKQKADYILPMYVALCYMKVQLGQLIRKMLLDWG